MHPELKALLTPDKKGKKPRSKTSNMLLYPFLFWLFQTNEEIRYKLHDGHIEELVLTEFEDYPEVIHSVKNCRISRVAVWRSTYNRNLLCDRQAPIYCSFRYNSDGKPVDGQTGSRVLSEQEQAAICRKHKINDPRFITRKVKRNG